VFLLLVGRVGGGAADPTVMLVGRVDGVAVHRTV